MTKPCIQYHFISGIEIVIDLSKQLNRQAKQYFVFHFYKLLSCTFHDLQKYYLVQSATNL